MSGFIAKQPNGLYCRFCTIADQPTAWNMTREDYLNNVTGTVPDRKAGRDVLNNHLRPFSDVVRYFVANNMTKAEFDAAVREMTEPVATDAALTPEQEDELDGLAEQLTTARHELNNFIARHGLDPDVVWAKANQHYDDDCTYAPE